LCANLRTEKGRAIEIPSNESRPRSSTAAAARAWSDIARRSPARRGPRSGIGSTGGGPSLGFGDPGARLLVVGLAPAAHGGNRTGRVFTGDRSGEWLFGALHRNGFANQAASVSKSDGLRLRDCYIAAAVRCAPPGNRPTPAEFRNCQPYLEREVRLLSALRVVVPLGAVAMNAFLRTWRAIGHDVPVPKPRFGHGVTLSLPPIELVASYHPSQRNTQTGLLTEPMFDGVFREALRLLEGGREQIFSREAGVNLI